MTPIEVGWIGIGILLFLIILRVPIAFASIIAGLSGYIMMLSWKGAISFIVTDFYTQFDSFSFSAIPMFILMGNFAAASGMTRKLFDVVYIWIGWIRGGLAIATIGACALFAAITGSGSATAATVGKVAYPEMKRYGYHDSLSTASIAAAGTLGPLIPPSGAMIIYAILTNQSIIQCLVAGIIPGIIVSALMAVALYLFIVKNPGMGPAGPKTKLRQKIRALPALIEVLVLFGFVIGGLYLGLFTPTQGGAAGAAGALIIGLIHKSISWKSLWKGAAEATNIAVMCLFLLTGSLIFGHFLNLSTIPQNLVSWAGSLDIPRLAILLAFCFIYIVLGCFIDALGLMVIVLPIVAPLIFSLGYDPIWFAVILTLLGETGAITPPLGISVFVVKSVVPGVTLGTIFKGIWIFFLAILVAIALFIAVPGIVTWLPSLAAL